LLQAGLHGDQGGDGHPVGVRQVKPEGDRHGGAAGSPGRRVDLFEFGFGGIVQLAAAAGAASPPKV